MHFISVVTDLDGNEKLVPINARNSADAYKKLRNKYKLGEYSVDWPQSKDSMEDKRKMYEGAAAESEKGSYNDTQLQQAKGFLNEFEQFAKIESKRLKLKREERKFRQEQRKLSHPSDNPQENNRAYRVPGGFGNLHKVLDKDAK